MRIKKPVVGTTHMCDRQSQRLTGKMIISYETNSVKQKMGNRPRVSNVILAKAGIQSWIPDQVGNDKIGFAKSWTVTKMDGTGDDISVGDF